MTSIRTQICTIAIWVLLTYVVSPSSAHASQDLGIGTLPDDVVMAIRLHDTASGANRGITFGVPVSEGALETATQLVVTSADGTAVPSQWNPLATWRTDGSVLHGAMTMLTTASGNNGGIYYVRPGKAEPGEAISMADIASSGFDATVSVIQNGTTYSLSAADLLDGTVLPTLNYTHYSGPLSSEFAIGGPLRANGSGSEHTLQAYFYVRAYGSPVTHASVSIAFENTGAWIEKLSQELTSVDVRVGGTSLSGFPKTSFTAYSDFRYIKHAWWNGDDSLFVQHDLAYVSDTKLMPLYRDVTMSESVLASFPQSTEWNQRLMMSSSGLDSGGAKPELAPYDRFTAAYMVSGDKRAWKAMRALVDEFGTLQSKFVDYPRKAAAVHSRDENTGLPLDLTARAAVSTVTQSTYGTGDVLRALRDGYGQDSQYDPPVAKTDVAHWPSIGYLPYLLTAESCELENVQMSAISIWLNEAPGGVQALLPSRSWSFGGSQVRGLAWGLREQINAAVATPDHHPLRGAMQLQATRAMDSMANSGAIEADTGGELGLWMIGNYSIAYQEAVFGQKTGVSAWMNDFLVWAVGSAYERGFKSELDANGLWSWLAQGSVGRMGTSAETGFCWVNGCYSILEVRETDTSPLYATWPEIWNRTLTVIPPSDGSTPSECAAPGSTGMVCKETYADQSATSYAAQLGSALAMAASTGISGAGAAWDIYEARQKSWDYSSAPEWAIMPRTDTVIRPNPPEFLTEEN